MCLGATARICFDLVSRQRLPLLIMQQIDFLFQVKRSPEWGQPQGHLKSWLNFDNLLEHFIENRLFESWCSVCHQPVLWVSCLDQSCLEECMEWMIIFRGVLKEIANSLSLSWQQSKHGYGSLDPSWVSSGKVWNNVTKCLEKDVCYLPPWTLLGPCSRVGLEM